MSSRFVDPSGWTTRCRHAGRTLAPPESNRLQDVGGDADGDALSGFPHRVARKMRIARGGPHPAVTEQPADDRQPLVERERSRGEGVT